MSSGLGKFVLNSIISTSVAATARKIIKNNANNETIVDTVQVKITTLVIGALVFEYIWEATDGWITAITSWADSIDAAKITVEKEERPGTEDIWTGEVIEQDV